MRTTMSIAFYCKESKANKQGLAPLEVSITINGERLFLNLPTKFNPKEFNKKKQPSHITDILLQYRIKVNEVISDLMKYDLPITSALVREYMRTGGVKSRTISFLWEEYNKVLKRRKSDLYKYKLSEELCYQIFGKNKELSAITNKDIIELYDMLLNKYAVNTSANYMVSIKGAFNFAKENDYIKINPFQNVKIRKVTNDIIFLTPQQIKQIEDTEFEGYLDRAKDLLLFQMYSGGMAYCDMINFDIRKLKEENGVYTYSSKRQKTNVPFTTIVFPQAIKILEKYNNNLPIITNQKLNQFAKLIARECNININLTTHIMRKTYACLMLNNGVSIDTIARMLGHTNSTITMKMYATKTNETIATEVKSKLKDLFS